MMCNVTVAVEEDPVQASRKKRNVQVNVVQADGKYIFMVPTSSIKHGKWECIFKSGNFEQAGKVTEFLPELLPIFFSDF